MSCPQDGYGGCGPRPRNDRAASARIAKAVDRVAWTKIAIITFGNTCRITMRSGVAPMVRAATMNSRARTASTCPLVRRAEGGAAAARVAQRFRDRRPERRGEGERGNGRGEGEERVDPAHDQEVELPAEVAGG